MAAITGLIIASILGAALAGGASLFGSAMNYDAQKKTNEANKEMVEATNEANLQATRETNAQNLDLAKNGITYRVRDLENAGLNKNLAAGGMSAPTATLSTPHAQAPQANAPFIDLTGISNAITASTNALLTEHMIESREGMNAATNQTRKEVAAGRNDVLNALYQRKGKQASDMAFAGNASQIQKASKAIKPQKWTKKDQKEWDDLMKFFKD